MTEQKHEKRRAKTRWKMSIPKPIASLSRRPLPGEERKRAGFRGVRAQARPETRAPLLVLPTLHPEGWESRFSRNPIPRGEKNRGGKMYDVFEETENGRVYESAGKLIGAKLERIWVSADGYTVFEFRKGKKRYELWVD